MTTNSICPDIFPKIENPAMANTFSLKCIMYSFAILKVLVIASLTKMPLWIDYKTKLAFIPRLSFLSILVIHITQKGIKKIATPSLPCPVHGTQRTLSEQNETRNVN